MAEQTVTVDLLGFDIKVNGLPADLPTLIAMAGGEERVVAMGIRQYVAHTHNSKTRPAVCESLEKATEEARASTKKDGKVRYEETEGAYIARLSKILAERGEAIEDYQEIAQQGADTIKVDMTASSRGSSLNSKPAKKWLEWVAELSKAGLLDNFIQKHSIEVGERTEACELEAPFSDLGVSDDTVYAIARKVKEHVLEQERKARDAAKAAMFA